MGVMSAPGEGAVKALWVGLVLLIASFALKQLIISSSMWSLGTVLESPLIDLEYQAERAGLAAAGYNSDRADLMRQSHRLRSDKAEAKTMEAGVSSLRRLQWYCNLKLILDALRLIGAMLVLFAGLHIAVDTKRGTWIKAYSLVFSGAAMLAICLGGLLTFLG